MNDTQKESHTQRKLLRALTENAQQMQTAFENIDTLARQARGMLSNALLAVASLESIRMEQAYTQRKADQLVDTLEIRALETSNKQNVYVTALHARINTLWDLVGKMCHQLDRAVTDDGLKVDLMKPIEGVEYVDMTYIRGKFGKSDAFVRKLIEHSQFTPHHAVVVEGKDVKHLWVKVKADIEIARVKSQRADRAIA